MKMNKDDLFDTKMKTQFKKELDHIPESIDRELDATLNEIISEERNIMKKNKMKKTDIAAAGVACALFLTMQTSAAQNLVREIARSLSLNSIKISENKDNLWQDKKIPEAAIGKVFDKDKNVVTVITFENQDELYNDKGEQVFDVDDDGTLITEEVRQKLIEQNAKENQDESIIVEETGKLKDFASFDVKMPTYLPEGFKFLNGEFYEENGELMKDAFSVYFTNDATEQSIYLSLVAIMDGSEGETSFNNIEEITINGNPAIIGDEGITWEYDGVRYLMFTYELGREECIKIAESIK